MIPKNTLIVGIKQNFDRKEVPAVVQSEQVDSNIHKHNTFVVFIHHFLFCCATRGTDPLAANPVELT
jgi:hypothetical protein